jgi:hypothetical protein
MPVQRALADPKIGEREVLAAMLDLEPQLAAARPGLTLICDKGFAGRVTEADLAPQPDHPAAALPHGRCRPAQRAALLKTIRQLIESVNDSL